MNVSRAASAMAASKKGMKYRNAGADCERLIAARKISAANLLGMPELADRIREEHFPAAAARKRLKDAMGKAEEKK